MKDMKLFHLLSSVFLVLREFTLCSGINAEFTLRSMLFNESRYNPLVHPRINVSDFVEMTLQWSFVKVEGLYEKEGRLVHYMSAIINWKDDFLIWDPALYGGITMFTTIGKQVWTPDIRIYNKEDSSFLENGLSSEILTVMHNGSVNAAPFGTLATMCDVNPKKFPVDCHRCSIILGSPVLGSKQLITWANNPILGFETIKDEHAFWSLTDVSVQQTTPFMVVLSMYLKRLPTHYLYNIVFPASGLAILSLFVFFVPIDEGERVSFGVTVFLSYMVLMLQVSTLLPENSKNISAIGMFLFQLMSSSLLAIFNSVVMSYFKDQADEGNLKLNSVSPTGHSSNTPKDTPIDRKQSSAEILNIDNAYEIQRMNDNGNKRNLFIHLWFRRYLTPLRIFDWITLLTAFILTLYAHVALLKITNEDTCAVAE